MTVSFPCVARLGLGLVLVLAAAMSACSDAPTAPTSYAPYSVTDLREGDGVAAGVGSVLTVHYTGWLYDGTRPDGKGLQFDTSRGRAPYVFVLGVGDVIAGWDRALPGMKVGGLRRFVLPPSLAYGPYRNNIIPPNATLVFEVELLGVE